jgi:alkylated DNA repair dioxygenase AlkB
MNSLFPLEQSFPAGFNYYPEFLSVTEETKLYNEINKIELHNMDYHGYKANRKTASFGYDYNFGNNILSKGKAIPAAFDWIIEKTASYIGVESKRFAEMLLTEYPPNAVINWHRDVPQFGLIAGISLLTDCTFKLRPYDKLKQTRSSVISFVVQRHSLYTMQDEARWNWQHSIARVKQTRYSITLRTFKN